MKKEDKPSRIQALLDEIEYDHKHNPRSRRNKQGAKRLLAALFGKKKESDEKS